MQSTANTVEMHCMDHYQTHYENRVIVRFLYYELLFLSPDPTLTLTTLSKLLKDVNWGRLHYRLDIPISVYYTIWNKYPNDKEAKARAYSDWYLNQHPAPSWELVAYALYNAEEHDMLAMLKDQVPSLKGESHGITLHW